MQSFVSGKFDKGDRAGLLFSFMKLFFSLLLLGALVLPGLARQPETVILADPEVLPLALEEDFSFRKVKQYHLDPEEQRPVLDPMVDFERLRLMRGAITAMDRRERFGNYFTFFWRAAREANLKVRLEFRQERLGPYVLAQEIDYGTVRGNFRTDFQVTGDVYLDDGRVTSWRAVLIEDDRIVASTQSFLWN